MCVFCVYVFQISKMNVGEKGEGVLERWIGFVGKGGGMGRWLLLGVRMFVFLGVGVGLLLDAGGGGACVCFVWSMQGSEGVLVGWVGKQVAGCTGAAFDRNVSIC